MAAPTRSVAAVLVFLFSILVLGWNIRATPVGSAFVDPIAHIRAQDESMYVNSSMRMAEDRNWLTPKLMGRFFLFKAPLLQWLSALSIELFGLGLITVRLPSLLMGAAGVAVVFAWTSLVRSRLQGAAAALLLISNPVWIIFSRLCFTDVMAGTLALLAMYVLACDPGLSSRRSRLLFGALTGLALMAKSIVGVLPFGALLLYCFVMRRSARPGVTQARECVITAVLIAAPWHVYQAIVHPEWFWIEFVKYQLFAVGVTEATGVTGYPLFYLRRLLDMDPVLCLAAAAALCTAWRRLGKREPVQVAALCWTAVVIAALAVFRGRSVSYLVLLIPGLCVSTGLFLPRWPAVTAVLLVAFGLKAAVPGHPWSLPYRAQRNESAIAIREYYLRNRDAKLVIASPDDAFYAITLPGLRVSYAYVDSSKTIASFAPHYLQLGIAVTPAELANLSGLTPVFTKRLSEWGLNSSEPVAEAILLQQPSDITEVMRVLPMADLDVPATWEPLVQEKARDNYSVVHSGGRLFLLTRAVNTRSEARPRLPQGW